MSYKTIKEAMDSMDVSSAVRNVITKCYYNRFRIGRLDDSYDRFIDNLNKPFDKYNDLFRARGIGPSTFRKLREAFLGDQEVQDEDLQSKQQE